MALLKKMVNGKGIELNYHRLAYYIVDLDQRIIIAEVRKYTSGDYRQKEKLEKSDNSIDSIQFTFSYDDTKNYGAKDIYAYLKAQSEFKGAIDG